MLFCSLDVEAMSCSKLLGIFSNAKLQKFTDLINGQNSLSSIRLNIQEAGFEVESFDNAVKGMSEFSLVRFRDPVSQERFLIKWPSSRDSFFSKMGKTVIKQEIISINRLSDHPNILKPFAYSVEIPYTIYRLNDFRSLADFIDVLKNKKEVQFSELIGFFKYFEQLVKLINDLHAQNLLLVDLDINEMMLDGERLLVGSLSSIVNTKNLKAKSVLTLNHISIPEVYIDVEMKLINYFESQYEVDRLAQQGIHSANISKDFKVKQTLAIDSIKKINRAGDMFATAYIMLGFLNSISGKLPLIFQGKLDDLIDLLFLYQRKFGNLDHMRNSGNSAEGLKIVQNINKILLEITKD